MGVPSRETHSRKGNLICVFAVLAVICTGTLWVAGTVLRVGPFTCVGHGFDRDQWRGGGADDQAWYLHRCGSLDDRTKSEVVEMLGTKKKTSGGDRLWTYGAGWTNDFLGPGDAQRLDVFFGPQGRVSRTDLLYD